MAVGSIIPTKLHGYDPATGNLTSVTLPEVYDPVTSTDRKPVYEYGYDERGNQTLIRDPNGHETWFTFDDRGRQESRTLPLGFGADGIKDTGDDPALGTFTESFEYDDLERILKQTSFEGVVTYFVYDDTYTGRLTEKLFFDDVDAFDAWVLNSTTHPPQEQQLFTYDARGRVIQTDHHRADASVDTFKTNFDDHGRVIREESPTGNVNYEYDPVTGRQTRMFTGNGADYDADQADPVNDVTYEYDALGRLWKVNTVERNDVTLPGQPETTQYYYDLVGNLDRTDLPNGAISDYEYDALSRLDTLTHYEPEDSTGDPSDPRDNDVLSSFSYVVRADGRRDSASETFWLDSNIDGTPEAHISDYDWVYDDLGRVASETIDHWDDQFDRTESFFYDLAGNRVRREIENMGDSAADKIFASGFDANDRLLWETADLDGDGPDPVANTTTFAYDQTQQTQKTVWQGTDTNEATGIKETRVTNS